MPACLGGTGWHRALSPLGSAAKPVGMGIRFFSCPPSAHDLFAKTTVDPKQAQPKGEARGFSVPSEIRECLRAQISRAATPQLLLEGEDQFGCSAS